MNSSINHIGNTDKAIRPASKNVPLQGLDASSQVIRLNREQQQLVEKMALGVQDLARRANEGMLVESSISMAIEHALEIFSKNSVLASDAMTGDLVIVLSQLAFAMSGGQPAFRDAMRFARNEAIRLREIYSINQSVAA